LALAAAWVPVLKNLTISGAKQSSALTKANEESWKDLPGHFDLNLHNDHHFFHCTNADDVTYKGAQPQYE
jgi:hypothetical protein